MRTTIDKTKTRIVHQLRRLAGRFRPPLRNHARLSDEELDLLARHLSGLHEIDPALPWRLLCYLVDGSQTEMLQLLRENSTRAARRLDVQVVHPGRNEGKTPRERFFQQQRIDDPAFFLRMAAVYQAAAGDTPPHRRLQWLTESTPAWYETFVWQTVGFEPAPDELVPGVSATVLARMLETDGCGTDVIARMAFELPPENVEFSAQDRAAVRTFGRLPQIGAVINRHPEVVRQALEEGDAEHVAYILRTLEGANADPKPFSDLLAHVAVSDAAERVRTTAELLLRRAGTRALEPVRELCSSTDSARRRRAVELLVRLDGNASSFLQDRVQDETDGDVREVIEDVLHTPNRLDDGGLRDMLSPLPPVQLEGSLPESVRADLFALCDAWRERQQTEPEPRWGRGRPAAPALPQPRVIQAADQLDSTEIGRRPGPLLSDLLRDGEFVPKVEAFVRRPELQPLHLVRLLCLFDDLEVDPEEGILRSRLLPDVLERIHKRDRAFGLRQAAGLLEAVGLDADALGRTELSDPEYLPTWPDDARWPYFAEHLEVLMEGLRPLSGEGRTETLQARRLHALELLQTLPHLPPVFQQLCWQLALESDSEEERTVAERCLTAQPIQLIVSLHDADPQVRSQAARWLADLQVREARPALEEALRGELDVEVALQLERALVSLAPEAAADLTPAAADLLVGDRSPLNDRQQQLADSLYEALCMQTEWPLETWYRDWGRNPIAAPVCRRLVWGAHDSGGNLRATFRPLADGSLVDATGEAVSIEGMTSIRLSHECTVNTEVSDAWLGHFEEHGVEPPFAQFGRGVFHLPDDRQQEQLLHEFEGNIVQAGTLERLTRRLGYHLTTNGAGSEQGRSYVKPLTDLRLNLLLEVAGEAEAADSPMALRYLVFFSDGGTGRSTPLRLRQVPPVLLAEAWQHLRTLANAGEGYDHSWRMRTGLGENDDEAFADGEIGASDGTADDEARAAQAHLEDSDDVTETAAPSAAPQATTEASAPSPSI